MSAEADEGPIARLVYAIRVEGHGDTLAAYLRVLSDSARPAGAA